MRKKPSQKRRDWQKCERGSYFGFFSRRASWKPLEIRKNEDTFLNFLLLRLKRRFQKSSNTRLFFPHLSKLAQARFQIYGLTKNTHLKRKHSSLQREEGIIFKNTNANPFKKIRDWRSVRASWRRSFSTLKVAKRRY